MIFKEWFESALAVIGALVTAGGSCAFVAYQLFQWFGKAWLDQQFKKQLEELKHEQQKEIEQLRHQIHSLFSRISKVHEKEFEVLPKAWELLNRAYGTAAEIASPLRKIPDVGGMTEAQFEEFLAASRLPEYAKDEVRKAQDRTQRYQDAIFWVNFDGARNAQTALNNYLVLNSIFMTQDLREQFKTINQSLAEVIANQEISRQSPSPDLWKSSAEILGRIPEMFNNIESAVQKRLRYEEA